MKIAFFGTSDRSKSILHALKENFELVLCVTKTDSLVGRHQEVKETGVKTWARENKVDCVEVSSLKNTDLEKVLNKLKEKNIEYGIVADFSFIIPYGVIEYFGKKLINVHFSLLPKYRGASPVQFSILNGEEKTGVTYHLVDTGMDTGAVLSQVEYTIPSNTTAGELYDEMFPLAAKHLPQVLKNYQSGSIKPILQDNNLASYTYSPTHPKNTFIFKEDALIDWSKKPDIIEREIRAYNPWPISWCKVSDLENNSVLFYDKLILRPSVKRDLILKIHNAKLREGKLFLEGVQVEGKNKTDFETFRNGYLTTAA